MENRSTTIEINHNQIHIMSGLVDALLNGQIQSDSDIPLFEIIKLKNRLATAHDEVKEN